MALKFLKDGKSAEHDGIPAEALQTGDVTSVDMLHWLLGRRAGSEGLQESGLFGELVKEGRLT